jgi:hypothetical protein
MVTYNPVEYFILIPKIVEYIMFLILAIKTYRMKDYIVNKVIGLAFFVWTFYTFSDLIQWITGANSITMLAIANGIRDVQIFAAMIFAYLIFLDTEIIKFGEGGIDKKKLKIILGVYIILTILLVATESLYVADVTDPEKLPLPPELWETTAMIEVTSNLSLITAILMVFPLILYAKSISTLYKIAKKSQPDNKRKMIQLIVGITLIPVGIIYFAIVIGIGLTFILQIIFYSTGRFFWVSAAFIIWNSQRGGKITNKVTETKVTENEK